MLHLSSQACAKATRPAHTPPPWPGAEGEPSAERVRQRLLVVVQQCTPAAAEGSAAQRALAPHTKAECLAPKAEPHVFRGTHAGRRGGRARRGRVYRGARPVAGAQLPQAPHTHTHTRTHTRTPAHTHTRSRALKRSSRRVPRAAGPNGRDSKKGLRVHNICGGPEVLHGAPAAAAVRRVEVVRDHVRRRGVHHRLHTHGRITCTLATQGPAAAQPLWANASTSWSAQRSDRPLLSRAPPSLLHGGSESGCRNRGNSGQQQERGKRGLAPTPMPSRSRACALPACVWLPRYSAPRPTAPPSAAAAGHGGVIIAGSTGSRLGRAGRGERGSDGRPVRGK